MKILLLCNSDLNGGAAVVTYRLMCALNDQGHEARLLVMNKLSNDPRVEVVGNNLSRKLWFLGERLGIFLDNGLSRRNLFKVSTATTGFDISRHPLARWADAFILSWVNQGMMSLGDVDRLSSLGKPVLWAMHDMWCMTGGCHHSLGCDNYLRECGLCQFVKDGRDSHDLTHRGWKRKMAVYPRHPRLRFVAVSDWLRDRAAESSLLGNLTVESIPNAFPIDDFKIVPSHHHNPSKQLIIMGAARLDDPIKNLPLAIEALNLLAESRPDLADRSLAVFYGSVRDPRAFDSLRFPHELTGRIDSHEKIRELYASGTVVLSTSHFETLPGTLIEGMAAGCTPVAAGRGGQGQIVDDTVTGYLPTSTPEAVAAALAKALDNPFDREAQHEAIAAKFSSQVIARRYVELIKSLQ